MMNSQTPVGSRALAEPLKSDSLAPRSAVAEFVDIRELFALLWGRKWLIAGFGFLTAVLAYAGLAQLEPYYSVEARVLLESRPRQVVDIDNVIQDTQLGGIQAIASEIALIQSPSVLLMAAERLDLASLPDFNPSLQETSVLDTLLGGVLALIAPPDTGTEDEEATPSPASVAAGILAEQISVTQLGESFVPRIQVTASGPRLAARIANTIAEAYLQRQVDIKLAAAAGATETLQARVAELRRDVERTELDVERLRAAITANGSASAAVLERQISELSSRLVIARIEHATNASRLESFNRLIEDKAFVAAMQIASSSQLEALIERRENILQQNEALLRRAGSDGVEARQMAETLAGLERTVLAAADDVAQGLEAIAEISVQQIRQQEEQLATLEAAVSAQSAQMIDLRALEREAEAMRGVYESFLGRLTETRELAAFQIPNASIVGFAEPPTSPTGPRKGALTILAAVFGAAAMSGFVIWRDAQRSVLRTPAQIEAAVGAPLIGAFGRLHPRRRGAGELRRFLANPPRDIAIAADRLAAALDQAARHSGKQVMLIASAVPREGTTALSMLLGRAFAQNGRRTVVVDCDARGNGFLKAVSGEGRDAETLEDFGVDLLRLVQPTNPALGRVELHNAMAHLRQAYEIVILDAPPILATAEALPFAGEIDAAILVVQVEATPSGAVTEAATELRRVGAPLLGAIAADVDAALAGFRAYAGADAVERAIRSYHR